MKIAQVIALLEVDGWEVKRITGSHRHYTHPKKRGLVTVAGKPSATLEARNAGEHPEAGGPTEGAGMTGHVVVFEGDEVSGYSAYSPDVPGVVAAGASRSGTEQLMREALAAHIDMLRELGEPVPAPNTDADVVILGPEAA